VAAASPRTGRRLRSVLASPPPLLQLPWTPTSQRERDDLTENVAWAWLHESWKDVVESRSARSGRDGSNEAKAPRRTTETSLPGAIPILRQYSELVPPPTPRSARHLSPRVNVSVTPAVEDDEPSAYTRENPQARATDCESSLYKRRAHRRAIASGQQVLRNLAIPERRTNVAVTAEVRRVVFRYDILRLRETIRKAKNGPLPSDQLRSAGVPEETPIDALTYSRSGAGSSLQALREHDTAPSVRASPCGREADSVGLSGLSNLQVRDAPNILTEHILEISGQAHQKAKGAWKPRSRARILDSGSASKDKALVLRRTLGVLARSHGSCLASRGAASQTCVRVGRLTSVAIVLCSALYFFWAPYGQQLGLA